MDETTATILAVIIGALLLVALIRGFYLVARSLGSGEEAISATEGPGDEPKRLEETAGDDIDTVDVDDETSEEPTQS